MATATSSTTNSTTSRTTRKPTKPRPADVCRLTIHIRGVAYSVRPLASEDGRAYRLRKADGTVYDVAETPYGPTCDCAAQVWRHEGRDGTGCKHIRALRAVGLIAGTASRAESAPADSWPAWTDEVRYSAR